MSAIVGGLGIGGGALGAAAASASNSFTPRYARAGAGRRGLHYYWTRNSGSHPVPGGGPMDRARRRMQIANGSLRVENGLVLSASA